MSALSHELHARPSFRIHLGLGIAYGYPLCCVLRFAFHARGGRASGQALARGCVEGRFVPCGVFHRGQR